MSPQCSVSLSPGVLPTEEQAYTQPSNIQSTQPKASPRTQCLYPSGTLHFRDLRGKMSLHEQGSGYLPLHPEAPPPVETGSSGRCWGCVT